MRVYVCYPNPNPNMYHVTCASIYVCVHVCDRESQRGFGDTPHRYTPPVAHLFLSLVTSLLTMSSRSTYMDAVPYE